MIKTILVPATGNETDAACYAAALPIARTFAAHLDALHVRIDPIEVVSMSTEGTGGVLLEGIIADFTRNADESEAKARSIFVDFCSRENLALVAAPPVPDSRVSAQFHVETGQEARWMAAYGATTDLIVASRGKPTNEVTARLVIEALLLETGRPLLIPAGTAVPKAYAERIAIAWKPTPQAARAVGFAMPFLMKAKDVAVITVEEEDDTRDAVAQLVTYLGWHGIKAAAERLSPGTEGAVGTLLDAAAGRELLVMGGYGHARLREWVFGGFTQRVLADAPIPVLIAH